MCFFIFYHATFLHHPNYVFTILLPDSALQPLKYEKNVFFYFLFFVRFFFRFCSISRR